MFLKCRPMYNISPVTPADFRRFGPAVLVCWKIKYWHSLQLLQKYDSPCNLAQPGVVVVIVDVKSAPLKWTLGVVQEVYPGADGVPRVALVKTRPGTLKRPVVKLCPLPTQWLLTLRFTLFCSLFSWKDIFHCEGGYGEANQPPLVDKHKKM